MKTNFSSAVLIAAFLFIFHLICLPAARAADREEPAYCLPEAVEGMKRPVISLNGTWEFQYSPTSRYVSISVPGEAAMQGFAIRHDEPFRYRHTFRVPADYAGRRVVLRFDGVYSHARLWVNGHYVREHHGGFTRWETDVTRWIACGKKNEIELEVTDRLDEISYASGYAHHPVGGILRDVTLFALPAAHLCDLNVETRFDSLYRDATLRLAFSAPEAAEGTEVAVELRDPDGHPVESATKRVALRPGSNELALPVARPRQWDAEHPHLYALTVQLLRQGRTLATFRRAVGFREVRTEGNRLLVNGRPVKLRGACRHDMHPKLGRTTTAALDSLDVLRFKEANMNFVRTSHYPPSEKFLSYCDKYGLYVECETAVCFVGTYRQKNYAPGNSANDPAFAHRYLGQCREMVKSLRTHPSILFWSLGNESVYGSNIRLCHDWLRQADPSRPLIFSYPGYVPAGERVYDLLSMHYPGTDGNLRQVGKQTQGFQGEGIPALFDEWAHPACYTYATLQTDPGIREFWGRSLDMMWSRLFEAPGGLGGAIWGYIDETFALPEPREGTAFWEEFAHTAKPDGFRGRCVGYGEWGIVDVWRRRKPEFWATKKAYSPVRLDAPDVVSCAPGQPLRFTLRNRFDHTRLSELTATYTYKERTAPLALPDVGPHGRGVLTIPAEAWEKGETLRIDFRTPDGLTADTYRLWLGERPAAAVATLAGRRLTVDESDSLLTVGGEAFEIGFDKRSGLIACAKVGGRTVLAGGPFFYADVNLNHLSGPEVRKMANRYTTHTADWRLTAFAHERRGNDVCLRLSGTYKEATLSLDITIRPSGSISISYMATGIPNGYLRETGLVFDLPEGFDRLSWQRDGYWDCYPADALAGNEGNVPLYAREEPAYGERPSTPWALDTRNYYYWADAGAVCDRPLTQAVKGMKENVFRYTLTAPGRKASAGLSVVSAEGGVACRLGQDNDGHLRLHVNNRWDYPEIAWGNYCKCLEALPCYGRIDLQLH